MMLDLVTARLGELSDPTSVQILLSPNEAGQVGNNIFLERADGDKLCNKRAMQFFERGAIFSGEQSCCG